jgi:hypothetical protein
MTNNHKSRVTRTITIGRNRPDHPRQRDSPNRFVSVATARSRRSISGSKIASAATSPIQSPVDSSPLAVRKARGITNQDDAIVDVPSVISQHSMFALPANHWRGIRPPRELDESWLTPRMHRFGQSRHSSDRFASTTSPLSRSDNLNPAATNAARSAHCALVRVYPRLDLELDFCAATGSLRAQDPGEGQKVRRRDQ